MTEPCEQKSWLQRLFCMLRCHVNIEHRIDQMDKRNREVRHDLNNIAFRAENLRRLVSRMREDDTWRNGDNN